MTALISQLSVELFKELEGLYAKIGLDATGREAELNSVLNEFKQMCAKKIESTEAFLLSLEAEDREVLQKINSIYRDLGQDLQAPEVHEHLGKIQNLSQHRRLLEDLEDRKAERVLEITALRER